MDVLIVIGDQDTYHEVEHDVVSSPIWLSEILSDEGLTGLFVLHARRAEILAEQGRNDVIQAIRRHEIGLHGRDVHPNIPEVAEGRSWHDGVDALLASEGQELRQLGKIFDVEPVCLSEHRNQTAPQIFRVARTLGVPYLFGNPAAPPHHSLSWYAGALNVPFNSPVPDFLGFFPAVFDDVLHDDEAFQLLFGQLRRHVERCLEVGLPHLTVFVCHPERLCYAGPLELWLYGNGANHGRAAVSPTAETRRSRVEIERALANFRSLVCYLRDTPGLEPMTVRDTVRRYGQQETRISRAALADIAAQAVAQRQIVIGETASAAESLLGFAESLTLLGGDRPLPETVARHDVLGPLDAPPLAPEVDSLSTTLVTTLARSLLQVAKEAGHLPAELSVDGRRIGLGSLYGAFAEAYLVSETGTLRPTGRFVATVWPRYPALGVALGERQRLCEEDPLVRPGLSTDALARHARLQTWTLKPAQRR
jgi:hypothetical protein